MSAPRPPELDRVADDLEKLSAFCDRNAPGWTRRVFSDVDRAAREWVAELMAGAGLAVETDAAGNLIGTVPGAGGLAGAVVTGSHTDTVSGGGRFDGIVGVLGAIEAVRCLRDGGVQLDHDLVVVDFLGEEPNDFGLSCVGSRAVAGALEETHLELVGPDGRTLGDALALSGTPAELPGARWELDRVHCFVELHIEQGPVLEQAAAAIGVVTGIVGIHRLHAHFEGQPDHAGTTPMSLRRDALLGAAEAALALERLADGGVATTGRLEAHPGALNVVPGEAELWAEARHRDEAWLAELGRRIEHEVAGIGERRRLATSLRWVSREHPVPVNAWVAAAIGEAAARLGIDPLRLASGAGHDASQMATLGPMGMIFIPSRGGRSHCPEEWTDLDQIGRGIAVLAETLQEVDGLSDEGAGIEPDDAGGRHL